MPTNRSIRLSLAGVLVIGGALLSGCATTSLPTASLPSSTPVAEQSVTDACNAMKPAIETLSTQMISVTKSLADDPAGVVSGLATASGAFKDSASKVTNTTVKPAADEVVRTFDLFAQDLTDVANQVHPVDQQKLVTETTDWQTAITGLATACS